MRPEQEPVRDVYQEPQPERYVPPADELLMRHSINIEFLNSGAVIRIGCKSIAFNDYESAMSELNAYAKDPVNAYKKWSKVLGVQI